MNSYHQRFSLLASQKFNIEAHTYDHSLYFQRLVNIFDEWFDLLCTIRFCHKPFSILQLYSRIYLILIVTAFIDFRLLLFDRMS